MSLGFLSLVLHAHLPFTRHPDDPAPWRDDWYLEALVECYLPLLQSWHRLVDERVPFRLTFSVSPTLLSMMIDPYLQERSRRHLDSLIELAEKELDRTGGEPEAHAVAQMYRARFAEARDFYLGRWDGDLVAALRSLVEHGRIELITTAATHGFLPGLRAEPNAVRAQLGVGLGWFNKVFGFKPQGMWMPECGYYPGLEQEAGRQGVRYFFVDAQALLKARPLPKYGVHAPVYCPAGVAAFARHPSASEQVWSSFIGYPGDPDYREFYRDIGWDLPRDYLAPYLPADGSRKETGLKYHRITGPGADKRIYVRAWALSKAAQHAGHFLESRLREAQQLANALDRRPLTVAPYDAELFGHWWFEGPEWLEFLLRKAAYDQKTIEVITPSEYLERYPVNQVVELCPSTWGRGSHNEVWVNAQNDYIYRHLHWAARRMGELARSTVPRTRLQRRAAKQAARELLLAQASDWAFMMSEPNTADYGRSRFREHMLNFTALYRQARRGAVDGQWLARLEQKNNIFPDMDLRHFR